jgi:hypothetical protein
MRSRSHESWGKVLLVAQGGLKKSFPGPKERVEKGLKAGYQGRKLLDESKILGS